MDKLRKPKPVSRPAHKENKVTGSRPVYTYQKKHLPEVKDFTYKDFKKILDRSSFTQQEWSDILHISERTLQRYAKNNGSFSFSVTDRILQIEKLLKKGLDVFGSNDAFMQWLRSEPYALEGRLSLQSLASIDGIQRTAIALGRIEQGLFA